MAIYSYSGKISLSEQNCVCGVNSQLRSIPSSVTKGQLFMCLVRGPATAQILCAMFIGTNNFFSGLIVRPQQMGEGLWLVTYWITPGHFVYEGKSFIQPTNSTVNQIMLFKSKPLFLCRYGYFHIFQRRKTGHC